jgi:hypothetical protein
MSANFGFIGVSFDAPKIALAAQNVKSNVQPNVRSGEANGLIGYYTGFTIKGGVIWI